jgi:hypothetical protein
LLRPPAERVVLIFNGFITIRNADANKTWLIVEFHTLTGPVLFISRKLDIALYLSFVHSLKLRADRTLKTENRPKAVNP